MSSNVKSVTLRIHTRPDRAAPGPPRPSPFLARPETLRAGSVVRGSWAVTRKPVGPPAPPSAFLLENALCGHLPTCGAGHPASSHRAGKVWQREAGRSSPTLPGPQAAAGREPQLVILSTTTPRRRGAGPAVASSTARPGPAGVRSSASAGFTSCGLDKHRSDCQRHSLSTPRHAARFLRGKSVAEQAVPWPQSG